MKGIVTAAIREPRPEIRNPSRTWTFVNAGAVLLLIVFFFALARKKLTFFFLDLGWLALPSTRHLRGGKGSEFFYFGGRRCLCEKVLFQQWEPRLCLRFRARGSYGH